MNTDLNQTRENIESGESDINNVVIIEPNTLSKQTSLQLKLIEIQETDPNNIINDEPSSALSKQSSLQSKYTSNIQNNYINNNDYADTNNLQQKIVKLNEKLNKNKNHIK